MTLELLTQEKEGKREVSLHVSLRLSSVSVCLSFKWTFFLETDLHLICLQSFQFCAVLLRLRILYCVLSFPFKARDKEENAFCLDRHHVPLDVSDVSSYSFSLLVSQHFSCQRDIDSRRVMFLCPCPFLSDFLTCLLQMIPKTGRMNDKSRKRESSPPPSSSFSADIKNFSFLAMITSSLRVEKDEHDVNEEREGETFSGVEKKKGRTKKTCGRRSKEKKHEKVCNSRKATADEEFAVSWKIARRKRVSSSCSSTLFSCFLRFNIKKL